MNNISLISDWKLRDPYVAMFKGQLLKAIPDANIMDITHAIELFSIEQTAFILKSCFQSFPEGTIHIILTGTSLSHQALPVAVKYKKHFFIGEDTGVFSLMFDIEDSPQAVQYKNEDESTTILEKCVTLASDVISHELDKTTVPYTRFVSAMRFEADYDARRKTIKGQIAYIDTSCNAVTNIPVQMFKEAVHNHSFSVEVSSTKHLKVTHYHNFYNPKEEEVYLLSNRLGYMELAINHGCIAVLADLHIGDAVEIKIL